MNIVLRAARVLSAGGGVLRSDRPAARSRRGAGHLWHLDSVAVLPGWQGRGLGSALIEFGLERARESGIAMVLETGTQRNVSLYERLGFRVVEDADAPEGGPHVWFMRRDP